MRPLVFHAVYMCVMGVVVTSECASARVTSRQGKLLSGRRLACMSQDGTCYENSLFVHLHKSETITITALLLRHEVHGIR